MDLHLQPGPRGDRARTLFRELRRAIDDGRLRGGERLPPSRELAQRLGVSRQTVTFAYEWLAAEGLLEGRGAQGSYVRAAVEPRTPRRAPAGLPLTPVVAFRTQTAPAAQAKVRFDLGVGSPDLRLFPHADFRRLLSRQLRSLTPGYGAPAGLPRLREALARQAGASRGVRASAGDVVVTSGAQHAFDLIGRVFVAPGQLVAVEDPGYPPARLLFAAQGARIARVPVDAEGLRVDLLPPETRLVYVTPSHQFPLGHVLSQRRRAALLAWAERQGALVVEDDYDSEYRFGGKPLDPLQAMDRTGRVLYVGSFSKTLSPALRLGYLVAPGSVVPALTAAAWLSGWHVALPLQGALATFLEQGLLARHVRKTRRDYAARHERLRTLLQRDFTSVLEPIESEAGLHLCARLPSLALEARLHAAAQEKGVRFDRLSTYSARAEPGAVLGYGGVTVPELEAALRLLRATLRRGRSA